MDDMDAFDTYRKQPCAKTLQHLLEVQQDRIYGVCFHILRHAQDAEDAAQDVILKVLAGIHLIPDAAACRRWIYRIAFTTALDAYRVRLHRRDREDKEALVKNGGTGTPLGEDWEQLYAAIARLDDDLREVLVRHYFEKATLRELAREQRCSPVAVWKKIEKGKERLRLELMTAGSAALAAGLEGRLEAVVTVQAPDGLIATDVVARAITAALHRSSTEAFVFGEAAMGAKKSAVLVSLLIAALFVGSGFVGGLLVRKRGEGRSADAPSAKLREPSTGSHPRQDRDSSAPSETAGQAVLIPPVQPPVEMEGASAKLRRKLIELRERVVQNERDRAQIEKGDAQLKSTQKNPRRLLMEFSRDLNRMLAELRPMVLADPDTYLAFLKDPATDLQVFQSYFVGDLLMERHWHHEETGNPTLSQGRHRFEDFPPTLLEGLEDMLRAGSPDQKRAVLRFHLHLRESLPPRYEELYRSILTGPESPQVQVEALWILPEPTKRELFPTIRKIVESCTNREAVLPFYYAIEQMKFREAEEFLLERLAANTDPALTSRLAQTLHFKVLEAPPAMQDRYVQSLTAAVQGSKDDPCLIQLAEVAVRLPRSKALAVLEVAAARVSTPDVAQTMTRIVEMLRSGTADRRALENLLKNHSEPR